MLFAAMATAEIEAAAARLPSLKLPFPSQAAHHMVLQVTWSGLICNLLNVTPCIHVCVMKTKSGGKRLKGNTVCSSLVHLLLIEDDLLDNREAMRDIEILI